MCARLMIFITDCIDGSGCVIRMIYIICIPIRTRLIDDYVRETVAFVLELFVIVSWRLACRSNIFMHHTIYKLLHIAKKVPKSHHPNHAHSRWHSWLNTSNLTLRACTNKNMSALLVCQQICWWILWAYLCGRSPILYGADRIVMIMIILSMHRQRKYGQCGIGIKHILTVVWLVIKV